MSGWTFLVDENVDLEVARQLRSHDYDAVHVQEAMEKGAPDDDVLELARGQNRILLTNDVKDFRNVPPGDHEGLLLIFDNREQAHEIVFAVLDVIDAYGDRESFVEDYLENYR